jgi:hypothetical protein
LINQGTDERALRDPANLNAPAAREEATGYLHPLYCQSLSEFGTPRFLVESRGWILERRIPNSRHLDAMGCYPLFACQDWSRLQVDLESIGNLVCLSVVTDPFGEYDPAYLRECFPDLAVPFKEHFVVDLSRPLDSFVHSHHRRNASKALREIQVEKCANPEDYLEDWTTLYSELIERHRIRGIAGFSRESFDLQLRVPGIVAFRAARDNVTVGMLLWYTQGDRACYHLGAYNRAGYDLRASFALFSYSIEYFAEQHIKWLNLGAGAGTNADAKSGLSRFKQGWSTETRTAYFCARVFDPKRYAELVLATNAPPTAYFPAYRAGEFS